MRILPAAAIPEESVVIDPETGLVVRIKKIYNSTPRPGRITWVDAKDKDHVVGGNERVEVVSLP